jgi:uncharacterized protein YhaN
MARKKLEEIEPVEAFPAEGLSRYEGLRNRLRDARQELWEKEVELKRQESALSELKEDLSILEHRELMGKIRSEQGRFGAAAREALSLREERLSEERRLKEDLNRLGSSWGEEKVLAFDLSIEVREEMRRYREIFRQAEFEKRAKRGSYEQALSNKGQAEQVLKRAPEPQEKDPESLMQKVRACRSLKNLETKHRLLEKDLRNLEDRMDDLRQQKETLESSQKAGGPSLPAWPAPAIVLAGLLLLVGSWAYERVYAGLGVAGFSLGVAILLWWILRAEKKKEKLRTQERERRILELSAGLGEIGTRHEELNVEASEIREQRDSALKQLGLEESLTPEELDRIEDDFTRQARLLEQWKKTTEDLREAKETHDAALRRLREAESAAEGAQERWRAWLEGLGLSGSLSPEGALETLSIVQGLREQIENLNCLRSRLKALEKERDGYLLLVNRVLSGCGRKEIGEEEDVERAAHELAAEFSEAEEASHKRPLLDKEMEAGRGSILRVGKQIHALEKEIKDLMHSAGAGDEEEFRRRADLHERRSQWEKEMEKYEEHLLRFSASRGGLEKVIEVLSGMDPDEMEEEKLRVDKEFREVESRLETLKKEGAQLEEKIRQLGRDDKIAILREEEESLREEIRHLAREWTIIRLSQALIRMARERYEREVQPEVISEGARFFKKITLGKYPSLVAPPGESRIEVIGDEGTRKEIGQLSRGTAEQLYLSLRFGFIQEYSRRSEPLPLIMDEILVNFDPSRAKATAEAIMELSREHQILYFTCHPETVALFREGDPAIPVLEIRGETSAWGMRMHKGARKSFIIYHLAFIIVH